MERRNDSRESILSKIKNAKPEAMPLPEIPVFNIPGNPLQNFICHLKGFDGDHQLFQSREDAIDWLSKRLEKVDRKVFSAAEGIKGNVSLEDFAAPAEMNVIDICVAEAIMAVGETGSLLVDTRTLGSPAAALFSTDLYLLIDRKRLVAGIQEAYSRFDLSESRYSAFFSGPSATADIEAVHITGAQGEISLTALMYNCTDEDIREAGEIMMRLPEGTPLGQPDAPLLKLKRETDPTAGCDSV